MHCLAYAAAAALPQGHSNWGADSFLRLGPGLHDVQIVAHKAALHVLQRNTRWWGQAGQQQGRS